MLILWVYPVAPLSHHEELHRQVFYVPAQSQILIMYVYVRINLSNLCASLYHLMVYVSEVQSADFSPQGSIRNCWKFVLEDQ